MYQFRDPVHGFIDVSEDELKIINSAPFQRLRNIHQLATTYVGLSWSRTHSFWALNWSYAFNITCI